MKHFTHFKSSILRGLLSLFFLTAMVSSAWGAIADGTYKLCTSTSDLEAGAHYIIASGNAGHVQCISTASNSNNRKIVETTVANSKIIVSSNSSIMTFTLGGSTEAWTFSTDNYAGTNGYLASAASGSNNHCRVIEEKTTGEISFSNNAAVITLKPHTSRNILRFNSSSSCFACYSSGQNAVYLYKRLSLKSITVSGNPTNTTYNAGEDFDPTGLTVTGTYSDNSTATITSGIDWTFDYGTGNTAFIAGATSVAVTAKVGDITSSKTTISGLTVNTVKTLSSITLSGYPNKNTYFVGEIFTHDGIKVMATYEGESEDVDVTSQATIEYKKEALTYGTNSIKVDAEFGSKKTQGTYTISVEKKTPTITIADMAIDISESNVAILANTTPSDAELDFSIISGSEYVSLSMDKLSAIAPGKAIIKAAYAGNDEYNTAEVDFSVTVNNLKTASIGSFSTTSGSINSDISFEAFKGNATAEPAIPNATSYLRLYQNGGYIAISGIKGVKIQSVTLTTGSTYVSTTVGYCVDDNDAPTTGEAVAKDSEYSINGLNNQNVRIYCLGKNNTARLDLACLVVKYLKDDVTLSSIAVSGEFQTEFIQNQTFSHDGAVVNATFSDKDVQDVTSYTVFSTPDMSTAGEKTVTVSYTHEGVTKSTSYNITISEEIVTSIALSGTYTKVFKTTDTFNHDGVVVTASYNSGRNAVVEDAEFSTPDLSTTGSKTVTVAYGGQQETYDIKVIPANTIFYESFDSNDGTGGNDGKWSGNIAANTIKKDNENWSFTASGGADQCARFGTSSSLGSAKTPEITLTGSAKITFKAAAWDGSSENTTLKISAPQGTLSQESVTMTKAAWTEYTIYLYGVKGSTQITFAASQASNNRFFLDEVLIEKYVNPISISSVGYATYVTSSALNFDACEGITAYKVSVNEGAKTVNLSPITEVPANEAIVVAGPEGTHNVPVIASAEPLDGNSLTFSNDPISDFGSLTYYVLAKHGDNVCFAPVNSGTIAARKGFFTIPSASAASFRIVIEDLENGNETAIPEIDPTGEVPLIIYTMTGIRIPKVVEDGLYIVNGKTKWMIAE